MQDKGSGNIPYNLLKVNGLHKIKICGFIRILFGSSKFVIISECINNNNLLLQYIFVYCYISHQKN